MAGDVLLDCDLLYWSFVDGFQYLPLSCIAIPPFTLIDLEHVNFSELVHQLSDAFPVEDDKLLIFQ